VSCFTAATLHVIWDKGENPPTFLIALGNAWLEIYEAEKKFAERSDSNLAGWRHVAPKPYRAIFPTDAGHKRVEGWKQRHEIVAAFLRQPGVSERAAGMDAEGIERHVSPETLAAFERPLETRR
jgi:hypothetical protein